MRRVKNDSLQSREIYLLTEKGPQTYWLRSKEVISVPSHYISDQIKNLGDRRILKIF